MAKYEAVAIWNRGWWDISFPDGVPGIRYAATNTGKHPTTKHPANTKAQAEELARDYLALSISDEYGKNVDPEDVNLRIEWKNERTYQTWYRREYGERDTYPR